MRKVGYVLLSVIVIIMLAACTFAKGSVLIKENITGTGCEIEFVEWSDQNKSELTFTKNDELAVEIACKQGSVSLEISSKSGVEVYSGNGLDKTTFTVKTPEDGEYVISVKGKHATGSISIIKLSK